MKRILALAIAGLFGTESGLSLTRPNTVGDGTAVVIEVAITAILMLVVMAVATDTRAQGALAAVAIGATVVVMGLVMGPITGASMNPARSIGPAVATGDFTGLFQSIALACRVIASKVQKAGLSDVLGATGVTNVQGESVQKLDELAKKERSLSQSCSQCNSSSSSSSKKNSQSSSASNSASSPSPFTSKTLPKGLSVDTIGPFGISIQ